MDRPIVNVKTGRMTYLGYYPFTHACHRLREVSLASCQMWAQSVTDVPLPEAMQTAVDRAKSVPLRFELSAFVPQSDSDAHWAPSCRYDAIAWLRSRPGIVAQVGALVFDGSMNAYAFTR